MENTREKLLKEESALMNKINKLHAFINSDKFNEVSKKQRKLLKKQNKVMIKYNKILCMRIADLGEVEYAEAD